MPVIALLISCQWFSVLSINLVLTGLSLRNHRWVGGILLLLTLTSGRTFQRYIWIVHRPVYRTVSHKVSSFTWIRNLRTTQLGNVTPVIVLPVTNSKLLLATLRIAIDDV